MRAFGAPLVALSLSVSALVSGCSGGQDEPVGAREAPTASAFCGALADFQDSFGGQDQTADPAAYVASLKAAATRLDAVGTPEGMPVDAVAGFSLTVNRILALADTATGRDLAQIGRVKGRDRKNVRALDDFVTATCAG